MKNKTVEMSAIKLLSWKDEETITIECLGLNQIMIDALIAIIEFDYPDYHIELLNNN